MAENIENQENEIVDGDLLNGLSEELSEAEMADLKSREAVEPEIKELVSHSEKDLTDEEYAQKIKKVRKAVLAGVVIIAGLILIILGFGLWDVFLGTPNKVIATIGEEEITVRQYETRVRYYRWQLLQEYARVNTIVSSQGDYDGNQYATLDRINSLITEVDEMSQLVLDRFIEDVIIQRKAVELGVEISEEEIEQAFYVRLESASSSLESYTDEMFQHDYVEYLEKNAVADLTEADAWAIRRGILLRSAVVEAVTVDAVAEYATEEQVWVRHILIEDEVGALLAIDLITSNEYTFEEMAVLLSLDEISAANGGDLGWFGRGIMVPEFEEAVFALEVGEISEPIRSDLGYHIIEVLDKKDVPLTPEQIATEKKSFFDDWMAGERSKLTIIVDEELMEKHTPMEPSFNDPKVFEAIFGITVEDTQATSAAKWEE